MSDNAKVRSQSLLAGTALRPTPDASSGGPRLHAPGRSEPGSIAALLERAGSRVAVGPGSRRRPDWPLIAVPAVTLAVMLWGIGTSSYWGDEADTVSAVSRSLPQLARLLGHIDAVHGLYYLMVWPVVRLGGTSELVTRLPSAVAMAAAAAGVTAIARRLISRRAGLCAGLVFAVLPTVSHQAHNARPYALITAAAVLASYLLIRVADDPRPSWLAAYALSLTLVGYLQLFGLLLVPAHAVALIGLRARAGNGQAGDGQAGTARPGTVPLRCWRAGGWPRWPGPVWR